MSPNNTIQPAQFVPNFVTGILFMNKADHTTFFGRNIEFIQGIHMIPLTAISPFIRQPSFVAAEWKAKLAGIINSLNSGWKGILMANLAISDPQTAWNFFTVGFPGSQWLDDGASLTWYLTFIAGLLAGGPSQLWVIKAILINAPSLTRRNHLGLQVLRYHCGSKYLEFHYFESKYGILRSEFVRSSCEVVSLYVRNWSRECIYYSENGLEYNWNHLRLSKKLTMEYVWPTWLWDSRDLPSISEKTDSIDKGGCLITSSPRTLDTDQLNYCEYLVKRQHMYSINMYNVSKYIIRSYVERILQSIISLLFIN